MTVDITADGGNRDRQCTGRASQNDMAERPGDISTGARTNKGCCMLSVMYNLHSLRCDVRYWSLG